MVEMILTIMREMTLTSLGFIMPCLAILTLTFTLIISADIVIYISDSIKSRLYKRRF